MIFCLHTRSISGFACSFKYTFYFSKLLKPLKTNWRAQGIPITIFFDDGVGPSSSFEVAKFKSCLVCTDLSCCGSEINDDKFTLDPSVKLCWKGYTIDTHTGFVYVSDYTIKCVSSNLNGICPQLDQSVAVSVRRIASVVGQIISKSASCGNVTEIMARPCMLSLIQEGPGTTLSSSVIGAGKSFYFGETIWFL